MPGGLYAGDGKCWPSLPDGANGLSEIARVVDTFVAPTATFKDILRSASWWLPFLLMAVITAGIVSFRGGAAGRAGMQALREPGSDISLQKLRSGWRIWIRRKKLRVPGCTSW